MHDLRRMLDVRTMVIMVVVMAIAIGAPAAYVLGVRPWLERRDAARTAETSIVPVGHIWSKTTAKTDDVSVNPTQYVMSNTDKRFSCYGFKGSDRSPGHVIKVVLAFGDEKSRDWTGQQFATLAGAIKAGRIAVDVCYLLSSDAYSALAMEALAEIDYNDPGNTWSAMSKLMMVDPADLTTQKARIGAVMDVVKSISNADGKVGISESSLRTGSFLQWSRVMTSANHTEVIPAVFADGKNITAKFRLYDPDSFTVTMNGL